LDFVLLDTVRAIEQLRKEGRTVLLHCLAAQCRTPTVAAIDGARLRGTGIAEALADLCERLSNASDTGVLRGIATTSSSRV
jgi:protein-tyrosine phosphatase